MQKIVLIGVLLLTLSTLATVSSARKADKQDSARPTVATSSGRSDEDKVSLHSTEDAKIVAIRNVEGVSMAEVRLLKDEASGHNVNHLVFLQQKHAMVGETAKVVWLNFIETTGTKRIGTIP